MSTITYHPAPVRLHILSIVVLISLLLSPQLAGHATAQSAPSELMERGNAYLEADHYDDAIALFDQVIATDPGHAQAYRQRGDAYRLKREYQKALADLEQATRLAPDDHLAHAIRGVSLHGLARYPDAIESLNQALRLHPDHIWSLANRGNSYYELGKFSLALADLDQAIALQPQYAWAITIRGKTHKALEDYESALLDFSRAIAINPQSDWALALRGQTYRQLERYEDALADLNRAIALDPTYDFAYAQRGKTYQQMGRYPEAIESFTEALALDSDYNWAYAHRGYTYQLAEEYAAALADFTQALALDPLYDWVYAQRGKTHALLADYDDAIADFSEALAIDPDYSWAYVQRGLSYQELEEYDDAIADFTKAISLQADNEWYWAVRADAYRLMGQYEDALQDADQAIALNSDYDFAWGVRGFTHRQMETLRTAITDFDRAIEVNPAYGWAYTMRGELHQLLGNTEAALADFQRAAELNGVDAIAAKSDPETAATSESTETIIEELTVASSPETLIDPLTGTNSTPTDAAQAVIRIETRRGDYVDFWETEPTGRSGHGSGFIVDPTGIAVTNNHVVTGATILKVYIGDDDTEFSARVLGVNECADLAVIQIQGNDFPYVEWYPNTIERRLPVEAIGFPLDAAETTFTQGIVSSTQADGQSPWSSLEHVLLHSAVINPGSSGGPLVDEQGRVVGINYRGSSARNQYFAISRDDALPIVEQLRQGMDVDTIGINGEAFERENGATGIWVYSVKPGSAADQAGIQAGDILASMGGIPLGRNGSMQSYCEIVRSHRATDTINVEVYRMSEQADCTGQINGRTLQCTPNNTPTDESPLFDYHRLTVEDGAMILEKPVDWTDTDVTFWQQDEEAIGLRVGIAPDLEQFHTSWDHSGLSLNVSTILAKQLDADQLLDQYPFGRTCTFVSRRAFERNRYQGQMEIWESCDGGTQNTLFVAAFTPADRAFIGLLIFQTTDTDELEIVTHLLNTLSVDVDAINIAPAPTPTAPPAPTRTPTRQPTATATPEPVTATVLVETLNVRTGPGTNYAILGAAKRNQTFTVIGQANSCAWVLIQDSSGQKGWLAAGNQYARVTGSCRVPHTDEILPTPTRSPGGSSDGGGGGGRATPPSAGDGCITFENQLNVELTITFTGQSGQGSRDFRVGAHASQRQCFAPGPYTYTMDAPPPWDDINGNLDVQRGMNVTFPIRGSN